MGIVDSIKGNLGNTQLPPNADKVFQILERLEEIRNKAQGLLVKVSYITIADAIIGDGNLDEERKSNDELEKTKDKYQGMLDSELNVIMEEFEDFYHTIEDNNPGKLAYDTLTTTESILYTLRDAREEHADILTKANQSRTINEFKRFS